jgi:hypothetical protein
MLLSKITPLSFERFVARVHRNRCEAFEPFRMLRDQFGVRVVNHSRDGWLMLRAGEEHVWS